MKTMPVLALVALACCDAATAPTFSADPVGNPQVRVRWRFHTEKAVTALALSADGKTLAVGEEHQIIQVYDLVTGRLRHEFEEYSGAVKCLAFSPDSMRLASASNGPLVFVWDLARGEELHRGKGAGSWVYDVAYSPDGQLLAVAGADAIKLFDFVPGKRARMLAGDGIFAAVAFAADGKSLAAISANGPLTLHQWDVPKGQPLGRPVNSGFEVGKAPMAGGLRLTYLLNGRQVLLGGPAAPRLVAWEATAGQFLSATPTGAARNPFALLPDGRTMIVPGENGGIALREVLTMRERRCFSVQEDTPHLVALSANGRTGVSGIGRRVYVWDIIEAPRQARARGKLDEERLESLWRELASVDAAKAGAAMEVLQACPRDSVPFLAKHLRPADAPDPQRLAQLMADLDGRDFALRQRAGAELVRLGELAYEPLGAVLAGKSNLEVQRRIEQLLPKLWTPYPIADASLLQLLRAVESLERMGTPEAHALLEKIAKGASAARVTLEAKAALARLPK